MAKKTVEEITKDLEKHVEEMFNSDAYRKWLRTLSLFPSYSLNNTLLIAMQRPDATRVCGYKNWQKLGRQVRQGEDAIRIYAPHKKHSYVPLKDENGDPVLDEDGKPKKKRVEWTVFGLASVFDITQTDGEPLPSLKVDELTGDVDGFSPFFDALTRVCPVPVTFEHFEDDKKGCYKKAEGRIAIKSGMSNSQTIKTLLHEMTHEMLHSDEDVCFDEDTREIQAESVAYTVCQHYGIDTSDYSFGYITTWASDTGIDELKASLDIIRMVAAELRESIDIRLGNCNTAS